jgi:hypothetical protein
MVAREGVGKVRHLACRTLWIQQEVKNKSMTIKAVAGRDNHADLGTKVLLGPHIKKMCSLISMVEDDIGTVINDGGLADVRRLRDDEMRPITEQAFVSELLRLLIARSKL